jgi:hypothetical protein
MWYQIFDQTQSENIFNEQTLFGKNEYIFFKCKE